MGNCAGGSLFYIVTSSIRMNLYVGNLARQVNDQALEALFGEFGKVSSANVIVDPQVGESRGFAFVEMPYDNEAKEAIRQLKNVEFFGRKMFISEARQKQAKR